MFYYSNVYMCNPEGKGICPYSKIAKYWLTINSLALVFAYLKTKTNIIKHLNKKFCPLKSVYVESETGLTGYFWLNCVFLTLKMSLYLPPNGELVLFDSVGRKRARLVLWWEKNGRTMWQIFIWHMISYSFDPKLLFTYQRPKLFNSPPETWPYASFSRF